MAAPTTAAGVKKALANPEPSTHGPSLPTCAVQQVGGCLGYGGRGISVNEKAAHDPKRKSSRRICCDAQHSSKRCDVVGGALVGGRSCNGATTSASSYLLAMRPDQKIEASLFDPRSLCHNQL
jgi:hypothetical protein